jgi:dCTP diphosphatase
MTFISVVRKLSSPNCVRTGTFELHTDKDVTKHALETIIASSKSNNGTRKSLLELDMDDTTSQFSSALNMKNSNCSYDDEKDHESLQKCRTTSLPMTIRNVRSTIFRLLIHVGTLSSHFVIESRTNYRADDVIGNILGQMIVLLMDISCGLSINLHDACMKKIQLNQRKYPIELCKVSKSQYTFTPLCLVYNCNDDLNQHSYISIDYQGKSGKYTEYSNQTGITKTIGQSTIDVGVNVKQLSALNDLSNTEYLQHDICWTETFVSKSISDVQQRTRQFAIDRDWLQYHTPRNLALALMGEIGELAEIFQFMGDDDVDGKNCDSLNVKQLDKIGQELADVTIYICRLLDVCQISILPVQQITSDTKDDK